MRLTAVVLAAGLSSRLGHPKQLAEVGGESLLRRAVRAAIDAGCDETIVVLPPGLFADQLEGLKATIVENPGRDEGIASSIRTGVQAAGEGRILVMLCDQPLVNAAHLRKLAGLGHDIVATAYAGGAGVPAIFAPSLRAELLALRGDRGARSVIRAHAAACATVALEAAAVDIDTPSDLDAFRSTTGC
ncbi:MAG: nucleotidyltransferase family protein [Thermoanaerobaculia bacterium]